MSDEPSLFLRIEALQERHMLEALQERGEELATQADADKRQPWPRPTLTLIRDETDTETPEVRGTESP